MRVVSGGCFWSTEKGHFLITLRLQVKERDDVAGVFGGRTILGRGKNLSQKHPDG